MYPLCSLEVENEIHFLIYCNKYDFIRQPVYQKLADVFPEFIRLDELGKFVYLMSKEDDKITEQSRATSLIFTHGEPNIRCVVKSQFPSRNVKTR